MSPKGWWMCQFMPYFHFYAWKFGGRLLQMCRTSLSEQYSALNRTWAFVLSLTSLSPCHNGSLWDKLAICIIVETWQMAHFDALIILWSSSAPFDVHLGSWWSFFFQFRVAYLSSCFMPTLHDFNSFGSGVGIESDLNTKSCYYWAPVDSECESAEMSTIYEGMFGGRLWLLIGHLEVKEVVDPSSAETRSLWAENLLVTVSNVRASFPCVMTRGTTEMNANWVFTLRQTRLPGLWGGRRVS